MKYYKKSVILLLLLFMLFNFGINPKINAENSQIGVAKLSNLNQANEIITYKSNNSISVSDGVIDPLWDSYSPIEISEFGSGGFIKTSQNGFYLSVIIGYESTIKWISLEFDVATDDCMVDGHDGWTFGTGYDVTYSGDGYFVGLDEPIDDIRNDIFYEMIEGTPLNHIEIVRVLDPKDSDGYDAVFNLTNTVKVQFAGSGEYHKGSHDIYSWTLSNNAPPGGTGTVPTNGGSDSSIDTGELSDIVFIFSVVMVFVTVFIHGVLRVISRPIKHEKRIVRVDKLPSQPTLREVFSRKKPVEGQNVAEVSEGESSVKGES
ncbi:MAG: hypothetical protein ACXAC7_17980 [Candidatus Hodarchaeales archaeon]